MSLTTQRSIPRLPLNGSLDLTYRCNNTCLHCWLWLPPGASQASQELTLDEIQRIVAEARAMGCQAWAISGGEPMLRPDFAEIFDYITRKSVHYKLNTNGTLITPEIARLLVRKGRKMVALYGATADVHDQVTRNPGSFDATMRGFSYLKETGAGFEVQIVPMKSNYHQYNEMLALAQSLSPHFRVGAPWLWLSACHSEARNREILRQRLDPADVITLDEPIPVAEVGHKPAIREPASETPFCGNVVPDNRLFASCIAARRDFHIDPYGQMSFCYYIKDPALRYDLRQGAFQQAWDDFIPSLAGVVRGDQEYLDNCASCDLRRDCRWCGVYSYLEHGRYSAKVDYLCQVAAQARRFKEDWNLSHVRYYQIAGITIQVAADFPITDSTFAPVFDQFRVNKPGEDTVSFRLVSSMPAISDVKLGNEVYRRPPWAIYKQGRAWVYLGISSSEMQHEPRVLAIFDEGHNSGSISCNGDFFQKDTLHALTTFPSDQIVLARLLADRQACYLHASGFVLDGKGLLFVGHSEAGKSTMMKMLRPYGEILCDDRIILRRWPEGFRIHGTWSHGELPDVSSGSAPLRAIFFLEKSSSNELVAILDHRERLRLALSYVIRPLITADWWDKILSLAGNIASEVTAYRLHFDKSGQVVDLLRQL